MFKACYDISGAITYDTDKIDATYANPETGYFRHDPTNFTAYAVLTDNQLTFYFDSKRDERAAEATTKKVFDIVRTDDLSFGAWTRDKDTGARDVQTATLDHSFKFYEAATNTSGMFNGMKNLSIIYGMENLYTDNVTDMSHMFQNCKALRAVYEQLWPLPDDPNVQHQNAHIDGYVPFFIKWNDGFMQKETELIIGHVTISEYQPQQCSIDVGDGSILTFKSTLAPLVIKGADRSKLFLGIDNILHYPDGKEPTRINALRAYFQLTNGYVFGEPESTEDVKAIKQCVLDFDNDEQGTTDIREMVNAESANGQWYDLSGRRISKPARGIYINGRKKVVVK